MNTSSSTRTATYLRYCYGKKINSHGDLKTLPDSGTSEASYAKLTIPGLYLV